MGEPIRYIPTVKRSDNTLLWASYVILILDLAFLAWGIVRIIYIAFPRLQFETSGIIFDLLARKRESDLDLIYQALQKLFLLPPASAFPLPDVLLNGFLTILVFVVGFICFKFLQRHSR